MRNLTPGLLFVAALWSVLFTGTVAIAQVKEVRNGNLNEKGAATLTQQAVEDLRTHGWTCPDAKDWPTWWGGLGDGMKLEYPATGGVYNSPFLRVQGTGGLLVGYYEHAFEKPSYIITAWAQGNGTLGIGVIAYKMSTDRKQILGQTSLPWLNVNVDSDKWVRYRHILEKGDGEVSVHPAFSAPKGTVAFDDVSIQPSSPALDLIVREEAKLYGTGYLIENADLVTADDTFQASATKYQDAVKAFREKSSTLDSGLAQSMEVEISSLQPYVLTKGLTSAKASYYNDMLVLTRVLNQLAGKSVAGTTVTKWTEVKSDCSNYQLGVRQARDNAITITDVRSNKVHYVENENADTTATVTSTLPAGGSGTTGTLVAVMHLDVDTTRELARTPFAVLPGETKTWAFSYSVGSETYGRAIEVRFVDSEDKLIDTFQEYYAVAAEYFRVMQHTYHAGNGIYKVSPQTAYLTQRHYFAGEPTDFGVQTPHAELYISGQGLYKVSPVGRRAETGYYQAMGVDHSFYQNWAFCGQMGYEEIRKHPEYALYDPNGQFSVDPLYGGYPSPMAMGSPLEVGPKRKAKPYVDRENKSWQHCPANLAMEDVLVYEANCIKKHAAENGFTGVYIDGNLGVAKGYSFDGTANVPSGKPEDFVKLNARNHRIYSEIVKKDNPNFGTWYNWAIDGVEACASQGMTTFIGSGTDTAGDIGDENVRAATSWQNVMLLRETGSYYNPYYTPSSFLELLIRQRDWAVQKIGANTLVGYSDAQLNPADPPGPSKWGWATVNYLGAQLIATQMHFNDAFYPSHRPTLQFLTRYSRFIWASDIKTVPDEEKLVQVSSTEDIWWKRLVYRRQTEDGYEIIVHLVRIPPTKAWDISWVDEPLPLAGVNATVNLGSGVLKDVNAMRPYYFEEDQQVVQTKLVANLESGKAVVQVPPFRYHAMLVFRISK